MTLLFAVSRVIQQNESVLFEKRRFYSEFYESGNPLTLFQFL